jgi:hypothetical protein
MSEDLQPVDVAEWLAAAPPEPMRWLLDGVIPATGFSVIAAEPKASKTIVSLHLALAVANGSRELWGRKVGVEGRVLLIEEEGASSDLHRRISMIASDLGLPPRAGRFDLLFRKRIKLDDPKSLHSLRELIFQLEPSLVILDPLSRLHNKEENSSSEMASVLDELNTLAADRSVIVLHHQNKGAGKGASRVRGTSAIFAAVDALVSISKDGDRRILEVEARDEGAGNSSLVIRFDRAGSPTLVLGDATEASDEDLIAVIKTYASGVSLKQIREAFGKRLPSDPKVRQRLAALVAEGRISQRGAGKGVEVRYHALSETEEKKLNEAFSSVFSSEEVREKTREPFRVAGFLSPEGEEEL